LITRERRAAKKKKQQAAPQRWRSDAMGNADGHHAAFLLNDLPTVKSCAGPYWSRLAASAQEGRGCQASAREAYTLE
jgi:hypothetical protein